jgi:hypothetical protein
MSDIIAVLVFDSWLDSVAELRNPQTEDRHLIYEGEGVILDLLLKATRDGSSLHVGGQVLPGQEDLDGIADLPVRIEHGESTTRTHTNALGEFMFHSVPKGTFDLTITLRDRHFLVRGLSSREPRKWRVLRSYSREGA